MQLPWDHARPTQQRFRGAQLEAHLSSELQRALTDLGKQEGCTLFMVLEAAFAVLLQRHGGGDDIVIGTPVAGREEQAFESTIGLFVNTLAIRNDLAGAPSFTAFLERVRRTVLAAFGHQEVPFERVVDGLQIERALSHSPLFQVMLTMQDVPDRRLELPHLTLSRYPLPGVTNKFDLEIMVEEWDEGIRLLAEYDADLFESETISRLLDRYMRLLKGIVDQPQLPLWRLPLIGNHERSFLLETFNQTTDIQNLDQPFIDRFEAQCLQHGHRIAASEYRGDARETLTYAQLNQRANRLAHHLKQRGLGQESLVSLLADRGLDFLTIMLAVYKVGAAYLPLDPKHPAQRHAAILERAKPSLCIHSSAYTVATQSSLGDMVHRPYIACSETLLQLDGPCHNAARVPVALDSLAYVIFTSGSTGTPKGAMVVQRGMINHLSAKLTDLEMGRGDRVVQNASQCFDISVWQFLAPLLCGAETQIVDDEIAHDPSRLLPLAIAEGTTLLELVPSMLRLILDMDEFADLDPRHLRMLIPTGEALPPELARRWLHAFPHIGLLNAYGPTECSDDVTHHLIVQPPSTKVVNMPIGTPLCNTRLYVVDTHLNPVPIGVAGEALVAGEGVGRGYLGDPAKTAKVFIPDAFATHPGQRLYRTGDLVRHRLQEGENTYVLEFLSRVDHQVKIRGFRIELGEIEAVLVDHPHVGAAVVRVDSRGTLKRLVAYVEVGENAVDLDELQVLLKARLPEYMVPSSVLALDRFPLTSNGKIDRIKLPDPEFNDNNAPKIAARTPAEHKLVAIWSDLLGLPQVGIHDNFFKLGGDSILTIQMIARARKQGLIFNARQVFQYQTIAELALHGVPLDSAIQESQGTIPEYPNKALLLSDDPSVAVILPLSPMQEGVLYHLLLDENPALYLIQVSCRIQGELDVALFRRAWQMALERRDILHASFAPNEQGVYQQSIHRHMQPKWLMESLDRQDEAAFTFFLEADRRLGFELNNPPLLRFALFQQAPQDWRFVFTVHHILIDGWSETLLFRDVFAAYQALVDEAELTWPAPARSFASYLAWRELQPLKEDQDYWDRQVAAIDEPTYLASVAGNPASTHTGFEEIEHCLDPAIVSMLQQTARDLGITLSTLFVGAWAVVLSKLVGRDQVGFGLTVSGRPEQLPDADEAVGLFINTLPVWVVVDGHKDIGTWLQQLQQAQSERLTHAQLPLQRIQNARRGEALFDHILLFENHPVEAALQQPGNGLRITEVTGDERNNFPLTITVLPGDEFTLRMSYRRDHFAETHIAPLMKHLLATLGAIQQPRQSLHHLSLLEPAGRSTLRSRWQGPNIPWAADSVVQRILERALAFPEMHALEDVEGRWTYGQLLAEVQKRSAYLRRMGVTTDRPVAVLLPRNKELVATLLAVMHCGAPYLPLDPAFPSDRLGYMLEDSGADLLVTHSTMPQPKGWRVRVLLTDRLPDTVKALRPIQKPACVDPALLAYVIYTSGSSGKPKGVAISHGAMGNFLDAVLREPSLTQADRLLAVTTVSFDISVLEIYAPLLVGASLYLTSANQSSDAFVLAGLIEDQGITAMQATPATWRMLIAGGWQGGLDLTLMCGGEAFPKDLAEALLARGCRIWNMYGPTETTVWSAIGSVTECGEGSVLPVGGTLANTQLHVADRFGNLLPIGVPGELLIGGAGLARGYLGRPALTAERFVPFAESSNEGARFYRTGDLVSRRPDGALDFLGRIDFQVKLRGYRIEPGEIEHLLGQHPQVDQAVVQVHEGQLVAWLQASDNVDISVLQAFLAPQVPAYMVPSRWQVLEALPKTPNHKLDRRALITGLGSQASAHDYVAPRNPQEQALVEVWAGLLKRERIGVHDNFFQLGGDSILSIQMLAQARAVGLQFSARQVFQHQTIAELAPLAEAVVDEDLHALPAVDLASLDRSPMPSDFPLVALEQPVLDGLLNQVVELEDVLPLSPMQEGMLYHHLVEEGEGLYLIQVHCRLDGEIDLAAFRKAWQLAVQRRDSLRASIHQGEDGAYRQLIHRTAEPTWIEQDWRDRDEETALATYLTEDRARGVALAQAPLMRLGLHRTANTQWRFVVSVHHLVLDGWSMPLIFRDVFTAYGALSNGETPVWQADAMPFRDYLVWRHTQSFDEAHAYWRDQLAVLDEPTLFAPLVARLEGVRKAMPS